MDKKCIECMFGGCCYPKYNNVVPCKNENVEKTAIEYDNRPYSNDIKTKMVVENNRAETCEYFVPHISIEEDDIEVETVYNISHKCPFCNNEEVEYDVGYAEGNKIINCWHCGKKYKISWSMY